MKSLLDQVKELDHIIRQLHKLASRIREGQNVDGWRECNSIIAMLETNRKNVIQGSEDGDKKDAK